MRQNTWLSNANEFKKQLQLLLHETDWAKLDPDRLFNDVDLGQFSRSRWATKRANPSGHPLTLLVLFLNYQWGLLFSQHERNKPREQLKLLLFFARFLWPAYRIWVLSESFLKLSHRDAVDWFEDSPGVNQALAEVGIDPVDSKFMGYVKVHLPTKDSATLSRWLTTGARRLYQQITGTHGTHRTPSRRNQKTQLGSERPLQGWASINQQWYRSAHKHFFPAFHDLNFQVFVQGEADEISRPSNILQHIYSTIHDSKNLILIGPMGSGKTSALITLWRTLAQDLAGPLFFLDPSIGQLVGNLNELRDYWFSILAKRQTAKTDQQTLNYGLERCWLVIDDLDHFPEEAKLNWLQTLKTVGRFVLSCQSMDRGFDYLPAEKIWLSHQPSAALDMLYSAEMERANLPITYPTHNHLFSPIYSEYITSPELVRLWSQCVGESGERANLVLLARKFASTRIRANPQGYPGGFSIDHLFSRVGAWIRNLEVPVRDSREWEPRDGPKPHSWIDGATDLFRLPSSEEIIDTIFGLEDDLFKPLLHDYALSLNHIDANWSTSPISPVPNRLTSMHWCYWVMQHWIEQGNWEAAEAVLWNLAWPFPGAFSQIWEIIIAVVSHLPAVSFEREKPRLIAMAAQRVAGVNPRLSPRLSSWIDRIDFRDRGWISANADKSKPMALSHLYQAFEQSLEGITNITSHDQIHQVMAERDPNLRSIWKAAHLLTQLRQPGPNVLPEADQAMLKRIIEGSRISQLGMAAIEVLLSWGQPTTATFPFDAPVDNWFNQRLELLHSIYLHARS